MKRLGSIAVLAAACILAGPFIAVKVGRYRALMRVDKSREIRLIQLLEGENFETTITFTPDYTFAIQAKRTGCVMNLREVAPSGYDRAALKAMAAGRRLFYVDSGIVSPEQPAWRTWAYFHFRRFASFAGLPFERRLTFAVTEDLSCNTVDWTKLSLAVFDAGPTAALPVAT